MDPVKAKHLLSRILAAVALVTLVINVANASSICCVFDDAPDSQSSMPCDSDEGTNSFDSACCFTCLSVGIPILPTSPLVEIQRQPVYLLAVLQLTPRFSPPFRPPPSLA